MAGKTRPMSQIKQLLQLHKQGMKINTIARTLDMSRNTVKSYLHKLMLSGIDEVEELTLKDWSEFTPDEVWAMQATLRALKSAMSGVNALVRK